jgi:hypothetical protein
MMNQVAAEPQKLEILKRCQQKREQEKKIARLQEKLRDKMFF